MTPNEFKQAARDWQAEWKAMQQPMLPPGQFKQAYFNHLQKLHDLLCDMLQEPENLRLNLAIQGSDTVKAWVNSVITDDRGRRLPYISASVNMSSRGGLLTLELPLTDHNVTITTEEPCPGT